MAAYNNFILTDQGIRLLGDLMNGNGELEFRCLAVGSGSYTAQNSVEEIRSMKELKEERQRVLFSSIETAEDGFVNLKANLTNKDLAEGYPMTEAGIYAGKKGEQEEILYCVSTVDNPDYMPDYSSRQIYNVIFKMIISIGDVSSPTISYRMDTYALAEDLQSEKDRAAEAEEQLKKDIASEAARAFMAEDELQRRKLDTDGDASDVTVEFSEAEDLVLLNGLQKLSELFGASAKAVSSLIAHLEDKNNPHEVSREQMQVDKVDNTSDMEKPVSTAQQTALDALHAQLTAYADKAIADLINGAPSTLDTLGEIAAAMEENADVVSALNEAVGRKANAAEFDSHAKDAVKHITAAERESWNNKLPAAGGTVSGSLTVAGLISAGGKARMWTDNEGGNFGLTAPDGTQWEIDAVDGNLRMFTYENGVRVGLTINKYGQVTFVSGAWSNAFHGTLYGALSGSMTAQGGVGGRGIHANANGFGIDLPPEEGYAGGLVWYQGNNSEEVNAVGCMGYYKQGGYHYIGTNYENPAGELRTGIIRTNSHIYIKYGCALYARHIEGAGSDATLFLNYNHPASIVAVGDTDNHAGGTGLLYVGTRAAIWTDAEGGNVHIMSPNDVEYQMDAFNDNLRLYRHVGDDYRSAFVVLEDGTTDFPFGVVTDYICGTTGQYGRISITPNYPGRYKVLNDSTIHIGFDNEVGYCVAPYSDNHYMLGRALRRWKDVYAANSAIITSDESLKRDITPLDENMTKDFIMGLQPISYIRTDGESGRTHYGMGAQSVERLMEELGMTSMDFAGLIKSPMYEDYEVEEEVEVEKLVPNENGKPIPRKVREIQKVTKQREIPGRYRYGLRYEEFIAPTIKFCQMLQDQMNTLKAENQELKDRLARVEKMLGV